MPVRNSLAEALKASRIEKANALIQVIGDCGRGFFRRKDRYARIEIDARGRAWWIDDYTEKRIYMHYPGRWRGFSNGGTLRALADHLREYALRGTRVPANQFGPWPGWLCNGDLWGYGKDMETVRTAALEFGIIERKHDIAAAQSREKAE